MKFRKLSPSEERVLLLTMEGKHTKDIARELDRSLPTIKCQKQMVLNKLGANSMPEAVAIYLTHVKPKDNDETTG